MIKGALTWLSRRRFPYDPLITVEISKSRLLANLYEFRKLAPGGMVAPVLKSNAYGHGLIEVAQILERENWAHGLDRGRRIPFFVVDSYFEAVALRSQGIKSHILIVGYTRPETIRKSRGQNTAFAVTSIDMLKKISDIKYAPWNWETGSEGLSTYIPRQRKAHRIHLKIDTGMHRQGIMVNEISEAMRLIQSSPSIILEGICSHLSDADNADDSFTDAQIMTWNKIAKQFRKEFPSLRFVHLSNTEGHRFSKEIDANVSRVGLGLYGLAQDMAFSAHINIQPILEMKTIITSKKAIRAGDHVGYGNAFTATKDMIIATIPVGYFEGIDRRLSGKGSVLVGDRHAVCPIIGRVSMNITSIDISTAPHINVGDEVITISSIATNPNSINSMAQMCGTIPYEIAVKIPEHLKRVVVE